MIATYLRLLAVAAAFIPLTGCGTEGSTLKPELTSTLSKEIPPTFETELAEILGPKLPMPGQANDRTRLFKGVSIVGGNLNDKHVNAILRITAQDKETDHSVNEIVHVDRTHAIASIVRQSSSTQNMLCFTDGRWITEGATYGSGY